MKRVLKIISLIKEVLKLNDLIKLARRACADSFNFENFLNYKNGVLNLRKIRVSKPQFNFTRSWLGVVPAPRASIKGGSVGTLFNQKNI